MSSGLTSSEILRDLKLIDDDGREVVYRVDWRGVPVGLIEKFRRRPPPNAPEKVRRIFRESKGKWQDAWGGGGFHEKREDIAVKVVQRYLKFNAETELVEAMLANDRCVIERVLAQIGEKFRFEFVEEDEPKSSKKNLEGGTKKPRPLE